MNREAQITGDSYAKVDPEVCKRQRVEEEESKGRTSIESM
jgi:hypothetical protein